MFFTCGSFGSAASCSFQAVTRTGVVAAAGSAIIFGSTDMRPPMSVLGLLGQFLRDLPELLKAEQQGYT